MLRNTNDLKGHAIHATDGDVGRVTDCFFDDEYWTVRYLVVDTGSWLLDRKVLISPISIAHPKWREAGEKKTIPVSITKKQVEDSPDIDTDMPVSRQHETRYLGFYGYPTYWGGTGPWADAAFPGMMMPGFGALESRPITLSRQVDLDLAQAEDRLHQHDDIHLRSCKEVEGYHIHATDGEIGHVAGFLLDDETWTIRYIVVDTSNWWLGHHVVISPAWINEIRWLDREASVKVSRQEIKNAAPYDMMVEFSRAHEIAVYKHYGYAGYWLPEQETESRIVQEPHVEHTD
jgi:hypothetical protein